MSTRSNIYLKLKEETKGTTLKFDPEKLPQPEGDREFPIKDVKVPKNALYMRVYHHWDGYVTGVGKTLAETYTDYESILNLLTMGDISSINDGVTSYQGWRNEDTPPQFINKSTKASTWKRYKTPKIVTKEAERDENGKIKTYDSYAPIGGVVDEELGTITHRIEGRVVRTPMVKNGELDPKAAVCEEYAYLFDGEKWYVSYWTYDDNDKRIDTGWLDLKEELARLEKEENA